MAAAEAAVEAQEGGERGGDTDSSLVGIDRYGTESCNGCFFLGGGVGGFVERHGATNATCGLLCVTANDVPSLSREKEALHENITQRNGGFDFLSVPRPGKVFLDRDVFA